MNSNVSIYDTRFFIPKLSLSSTNKEVKFKFLNKEITSVCSNSNKHLYSQNTVWVCSRCGHVHIGFNTPDKCPICNSQYSVLEN